MDKYLTLHNIKIYLDICLSKSIDFLAKFFKFVKNIFLSNK